LTQLILPIQWCLLLLLLLLLRPAYSSVFTQVSKAAKGAAVAAPAAPGASIHLLISQLVQNTCNSLELYSHAGHLQIGDTYFHN
jgi:hypothetical protein